jgi:hypothetical protein
MPPTLSPKLGGGDGWLSPMLWTERLGIYPCGYTLKCARRGLSRLPLKASAPVCDLESVELRPLNLPFALWLSLSWLLMR